MCENKEIFFYGTRGPYGCFSNFFQCEFQINGVTYTSVEQYFMAQKALCFLDQNTYSQIMGEHRGAWIKALGLRVRPFNADVWALRRLGVMRAAIRAKFLQNPHLMQVLTSTGDALLYEASPHDRFWGIGYGHRTAPENRRKWGLNHLGDLLMQTRAGGVPPPETPLIGGANAP